MYPKKTARQLSYGAAIQEALMQGMSRDKNIFVMGIGVTDYKGIFGTTTRIAKRFGHERVIETPASENAVTGIAIGAALKGKRPVVVHARNDFMFLTLDQMFNSAAKWKYTYGGKSNVPFTVRGIIGKGWGQGPTHSQSIQSLFAHFPGITVVMPSTPYDVKGALIASFKASAPTVILEHRALYNSIGEVPAKYYELEFGKARIVRKGKDITVVGISLMVQESVKAAIALGKMGISAEVIDPRTLSPLDETTIINSVKKTGRLLVCDTSWLSCSFASEVAAMVQEKAFRSLKGPVVRMAMSACPCPVAKSLEDIFYPTYKDIFIKCSEMLGKKPKHDIINNPIIDNFKGPY